MSNILTSYINGNLTPIRPQAKLIDNINPATGQIINHLQCSDEAEVQLAIDSAKQGQKVWASMTAVERCRILLKAVNLLREENDRLALIETQDTGKPLSETRFVDIVTGADVIEYYAGLATAIEGRQIPLRETSFVYTRQEPLGVVAGIGAWNYPIQIAMWKSAPALASGNAMIFKPSEVTPTGAIELAKIFTQAGVPNGVFNVVQGDGEVGQMLSKHPDIAKISFTGSVPSGKKVMSSSALSSLKEVTMELGGKSPLIICDDADINLAVNIAMMANFYSSGQVCTNGTRVFIPHQMKAIFEQKLLEKITNIRIGNPEHEETNFGPLVSFEHMNKVLSYIDKGIKEGATLLTGGKRLQNELAQGAYVEPTIFTDCQDNMAIVQDEIFGPVMCILTYDSEEEAITRANQTTYGLAGGVVTNNLAKAHRIIAQIEAGICWINTWGESPATMPVGGYKQSGIGRENGIQTLLHYTQTKSVQVELGQFQSVF